jgi:glycosyltransferase involved in cell wall biosynthesis
MDKKKRVTFVGAFDDRNKQNAGGQLFACTSLVKSKLSEAITWDLIDTTASTNQERGFVERSTKAILRIWKFVYSLFRFKPQTVLIFFAHGGSFIEKGIMALIAKLMGKRVVVCPRAGQLIEHITLHRFWKKFARLVFSAADVVVCQSGSWKLFFEEQVGFKSHLKYTVIRNWILTHQYDENFVQRHKLANASTIKILFLGWVIKDKGIFELLDAFNQLQSPSVRLWIAGDGPELEAAKAKVSELKLSEVVHFYGWVFNDQKMQLLKEADIFVLPSYAEGMPNAVLEAMASGIPVVATTVGGIPDLIKDNVNGFLVKPGDANMLAEKITLLINDAEKRKSFSESAHVYSKENHSVEAAIESFRQIL